MALILNIYSLTVHLYSIYFKLAIGNIPSAYAKIITKYFLFIFMLAFIKQKTSYITFNIYILYTSK